jgi:UDP-galactopyranose mutase
MLDNFFEYVQGELPYRSLQFVYETHDVDYFQPATTVNYPNTEKFTRITEFKHILPVEVKKTVIVKEFPQDFDKNDPERNVPYYPVFNQENAERYSKYRELLRDYPQILAIGRLAEYRYYNMDQVVGSSLALVNKILDK